MSRSPNYPAITIEEAIADAKSLWAKMQRSTVTPEEVAKHLNYKGLTGTSRPRIAALKSYGILEKRGKGLTLADLAVNIAVRGEESNEYKQAVGEAIRSVDLFADLLLEHANSSQKIIEEHLIIDRAFTEDGAKKATEAFLAAKKLLGDQAGGTIEAEAKKSDSEQLQAPKIGDYVQWTNMDQAQFLKPRQLLGISDDEQYAFVEGTKTGIPMSELTLQDPPETAENPIGTPPPNPFARPAGSGDEGMPPAKGTKQATLPTDSGLVKVEWPDCLSKDDFEDIKDWLKILERKIERSADSDTADD